MIAGANARLVRGNEFRTIQSIARVHERQLPGDLPLPSLADLAPGQSATIDAIEGTAVAVQRLMEMGLTEGERVSLIRVAPLGDPIEIRIRQYDLSLRKADAARIHVRMD